MRNANSSTYGTGNAENVELIDKGTPIPKKINPIIFNINVKDLVNIHNYYI